MSPRVARSVTNTIVKPSRYRWTVCALLFAATSINYVDRQMIGLLKPILQGEMHWSEEQYAQIIFWFQAAYAVGFLVAGRLVDTIGAKLGYAITFSIWTIAHIAHGFVGGVVQFAVARFALGLGEAGNFPSGLKAVTEWFPPQERAFAVGLFNAGANVGAILTPLAVPAITLALGWRAAFVVTGLISSIWLAVWLRLYRQPETLPAPRTLASNAADATISMPWRRLFLVRETWAYIVPKFLTDPIWWMLLFWLPDFLAKRYGLNLKDFGLPLVAIYLLSDVGSVLGGWISSRLIRRGWSVNAARKTTMFGCAIAVLPIATVETIDQLWLAVPLLGLAAAGHQAFSANLLTLPSDLFPRETVASISGIGGTAGAIGGMLIAKFVGWVLDFSGSYGLIFGVAAVAYLAALASLHLISPRLAPVHAKQRPDLT